MIIGMELGVFSAAECTMSLDWTSTSQTMINLWPTIDDHNVELQKTPDGSTSGSGDSISLAVRELETSFVLQRPQDFATEHHQLRSNRWRKPGLGVHLRKQRRWILPPQEAERESQDH
jgi:hypothetical protein